MQHIFVHPDPDSPQGGRPAALPGRFSGVFICFAVLVLSACVRHEPALQLTRVRIAVPLSPITYLVIYLAQDLGFYREQGLDVVTDDTPGGSKALQAMFGGSDDICACVYDLAIQLKAEGRDVRSFLTIMDRPGIVLAVSPATKRSIHRVEDLKGATVGVSTPGAATHLFVNYLLASHGVRLDQVGIAGIGLGAPSIAAFDRGHIDAAALAGSAITTVMRRFPNLVVLADGRTAAGVKEIYGLDLYPAHDLLAPANWLRKNPQTARKLARAVSHAMDYMRQHSPEEIRTHIRPQYRSADEAADIEALRATVPMLSRTRTITPESAEAVRKVLAVSSVKIRATPIDLSQTYTNQFVEPQ